MYDLRFKDGVSLCGIREQTICAISLARHIYSDYGYDTIVTSLNDGAHMARSLHYSGFAVDFRTRHLGNEHRQEIAAEIAIALGDDYDVVLEKDHLHVEYDPK